ncbi:hypothetical protein [Gilvimarinus polysaccharolyticus]|uniref:hypothetical protein n=1 Tax=Gilvimarinus polysaccharolyticus TaxID=863921 RepID=UPI00067388A1|nr:hypothetical protein [Gilvimarinus polysaccharolyticus]
MTTVPAFYPQRYFWLQSLLLLSLLAIIAYYWQVDDVITEHAAREGGLIDLTSALGYFLCSGLMVVLGGKYMVKHHYPLIISVVLLGLRELDFDKRYSSLGLFKSATFRSQDVSILEKVVTLGIILMVIWLVIILITKYLRPLLARALEFNMLALSIACAGGLLVVARTLDGIARKLATFDINISLHTGIHTTIIEEVFELGAPYSLIIALFCYLHVYRRTR